MILRAIVFIVWKYWDSRTDPEERMIKMNVLKNLVENSKVFPKVFNANCNEVLSSQKKAATNYYFNMLGCYSIFAKRGNSLINVLKMCAVEKEKRRTQ